MSLLLITFYVALAIITIVRIWHINDIEMLLVVPATFWLMTTHVFLPIMPFWATVLAGSAWAVCIWPERWLGRVTS